MKDDSDDEPDNKKKNNIVIINKFDKPQTTKQRTLPPETPKLPTSLFL